MARLARAVPENAPGDLFVDDACIACDTCRALAPATFGGGEDGNVLVDSPRFAVPLLERIRALGGARLMFLTHRDDVADHARWREALGCERVLHARDLGPATRGVERRLEGDAPVGLGEGLVAIPVPGHTAGSTALLADDTYLFTGDHLWGDAAGRLGASASVCWWSWEAQLASLERLADRTFTWVLPGHGRPWRAASHVAGQEARQRAPRHDRGEGQVWRPRTSPQAIPREVTCMRQMIPIL